MSKFDDIATIQILSNINEKKITNMSEIKNKKKDISNEKNNCIAAVKYNTIGNAYKDRMKNIDVYLVKEEKNGNIKTHAYSRCSKTTQDGTHFCHLHCRMTKYNNDGLKIFDKDILPSNQNDKTRWLANINDDFFENMGKRGAKKKNGENNFTFPDENHPVLLILTHKNAKLATKLSIYASQLLKNSNYECLEIISNNIKDYEIKKTNSKKTKEIIKTDNTSDNISNLISMISKIDKSSELLKKSIDNDDKDESDKDESDKDESDKDESDKDKSDKDESDKDKSDKDESDKDESDDIEFEDIESKEDESKEDESKDVESEDEGVSCIPIYTNKKKLLWYNEDNKVVYEPEGEDGGEEIGILKEISDEYYTINHNGKLYTVLKEINVKKKGNIYCCVLTDSLFDKELNFIGTRTKIKNNEYRFDFNK
jgi:hypothetical protein